MSKTGDFPYFIIQRITKQIDFVIDKTSNLTKHFDGSGMDSNIRTFCLLMLDRLNLASVGIKGLLAPLEKNNKIEFSIGLIIRSVILDHMLIIHVLSIIKDAKQHIDQSLIIEEVNNVCHSYLVEGLGKQLTLIEKIKPFASAEKVKNIYSNLYNLNPNYFKPYNHNGTKPELLKHAGSKTGKKNFDMLKEKNSFFKNYNRIYFPYAHYSKYDHFGILHYEYSRQDDLFKLQIMKEALNMFPEQLRYTAIIFHALLKDSVLDKTIKETTKFITELNNEQ